MRLHIIRAMLIAAAGLSLAGCKTSSDTNMFASRRGSDEARASMPLPPSASETTGSVTPRQTADKPAAAQPSPRIAAPESSEPVIATPVLPGSDGKDDVIRGREQFRAGNYAEAESAFDRAAKMNPRDHEAWLGLAACYDRMRRFELADRAYGQALSIKGPTAEILNNQGYSYLLRGDLQRARAVLSTAQKKQPGNTFVQSNLKMLEQKERSASVR